MLKKLVDYRYQILLWTVVIFSAATNIFLIASRPQFDYAEYQDTALDDSSQVESTTLVASNEPENPLTPLTENPEPTLITYDINSGDTFSSILEKYNVPSNVKSKVLSSLKKSLLKYKLKPGDRVFLELAQNQGIISLSRFTVETDDSIVELTSTGQNSFESKKVAVPIKTQTKLISGTIEGSLYSAARKAGADQKLIKEFINLLTYNVDFQRDIKRGDTFRIFYEYGINQRNKTVKKPQIVYASLSVDGEQKEVFRYKLSSGKTDYFDGNGNNVKKTLLRTPINGAKISSSFGMRNHPVHGYSKMHQGVDFSAPRGTPILAAGDGIIKKVTKQNRGYGNFVQIEHNKTYSTLYAHMSKFANGIRPGKAIKQGQIIGYVGATGVTTGPHLHYEVIQNGAKVNPAKVSFARVAPLAGVELAKFKKALSKIESVIANADYSAPQRIAANVSANKSEKLVK